MLAGIEIGGTKIIIAAGTGPSDLTAPVRLPTTNPADSLTETVRALTGLQEEHGPLTGIGIASFGPIGVRPGSADYGRVLRTPKAGWSGADIVSPIRAAFPGVPITLDTDVNGAGLAEQRWGRAVGLDDFAYVTVGTGVGVGIFSRGRPIHGLLHPEAGHVLIQRQTGDDFTSCCPFHADCLEGLAAGPAIRARAGRGGEELAGDHEIWALVGDYLAQLFYAMTLVASPQCIVVGGSVGLREEVLAVARIRLHALLGNYIEALEDIGSTQHYLRPAALQENTGVLGAIGLAMVGTTGPA